MGFEDDYNPSGTVTQVNRYILGARGIDRIARTESGNAPYLHYNAWLNLVVGASNAIIGEKSLASKAVLAAFAQMVMHMAALFGLFEVLPFL